jgi:hypothetical protein
VRVGEITDVPGLSVLFAFVSYTQNNQAEEQIRMCKPLLTHTTGEDIFNITDLYMDEKGPTWK